MEGGGCCHQLSACRRRDVGSHYTYLVIAPEHPSAISCVVRAALLDLLILLVTAADDSVCCAVMRTVALLEPCSRIWRVRHSRFSPRDSMHTCLCPTAPYFFSCVLFKFFVYIYRYEELLVHRAHTPLARNAHAERESLRLKSTSPFVIEMTLCSD